MSRRLVFVVIFYLTAVNNGWPQNLPFQVKVLSAESRQFQAPPIDPPNCDWKDISAYCYNSSPETYLENTMVVQKSDGNSYEIACTVYNRWSHCASLPVDQSFRARMEDKRGLEIRYMDQHGKMRKQLYAILSESGKQAGK
jgi:hypothetical protein